MTFDPSVRTLVPHRDLWLFVICTVRYSMGRTSYVVSEACGMVRRYRKKLKPEQVKKIADEVAYELTMQEKLGATLGHDIDHREWKKLVEELRGSE